MSFIISSGIIIPPLTAGAVPYGTGSQVLMNAQGSSGYVLLSGGTGAPTWAPVAPSTQELAGGVAGDLPYQQAPSDTTFLPIVQGGILYGTANAPAYTGVGTAGQPLLSGGLSAPTFGTLSVAHGGTGAPNAAAARTNLVAQETLVSGTNIKTVGGQSLLGSGNISVGSGTVTSVSGTGTVQGITLSGTVTSSGNLTLGGSLSAINLASQVTGTLGTSNGGTGVTTGPFGLTLIGSVSTVSVASGSVSVTGWQNTYKYLFLVWVGQTVNLTTPNITFNSVTSSFAYQFTQAYSANQVQYLNAGSISLTDNRANGGPCGLWGTVVHDSVSTRNFFNINGVVSNIGCSGHTSSSFGGAITSVQFNNSGSSNYMNTTAYVYGGK